MKSAEVSGLPETFRGGGIEVDFDRSICLPPDMAGVAMGYETASVLNTMRTAESNPTLPVQALELGTGSGVCLAALLHGVWHKQGLTVTGFDIDEAAVNITRHNLAKATQKTGQSIDSDIFAADWRNDDTWQRLRLHSYDVVMCNPPYLAEGAPLMDGYESVPRAAVYSEGDGLAHHRFLLPRLLGLLSVRTGATLITRFPSTIHGQNELSQSIDDVIGEAVTQTPSLSGFAIVRRILAPVAVGRNMASVTISRSDGPLPPHMRLQLAAHS